MYVYPVYCCVKWDHLYQTWHFFPSNVFPMSLSHVLEDTCTHVSSALMQSVPLREDSRTWLITGRPLEISLLCHHRWWGEAHLVCVFAFVSVSVGYIPSSGTARSQGKCVHSLDQWWRIAFQKTCSLCIPNASVCGICFSAPLTAGFIKHFHTLQSDGWENGTVSLWCAFL